MWNQHLTIALSAVFTFWTGMAWGRPLSVSSPYPVVPDSESKFLVCYIQTQDGRTLNLESLCQKKKANADNISNQCLFIDSTGHLCKISSSARQENSQTNSDLNDLGDVPQL